MKYKIYNSGQVICKKSNGTKIKRIYVIRQLYVSVKKSKLLKQNKRKVIRNITMFNLRVFKQSK